MKCFHLSSIPTISDTRNLDNLRQLLMDEGDAFMVDLPWFQPWLRASPCRLGYDEWKTSDAEMNPKTRGIYNGTYFFFGLVFFSG